jgi:hypothetical protein
MSTENGAAENGKTALAGYIPAFERLNGRTPTDEENREALALVEVVRKSNLDPFLIFYLANKKAQDALERVPVETRAVMAEAGITAKAFHAFAERLERVEQIADDAKGRLVKAKIGERDDIPGIRNPQMDRIEARQHEFDSRLRSLDAHIRAGSTPGIAPLAVHIVALLILVACIAVGYVARMMPLYGSIVIIAVVAVLAYLYLAPLIAPSLAGALRKVVR